MKYEIALQPDATIIIQDIVYNVSSSTLGEVSPALYGLLNSCKDRTLRLSPTEDAQAFLYFLRAAHGIFVPYEEVTSPILTELALLLGRYGVKPNNPPYDLVQFCFTKRTLRPSELPALDLSWMMTVARVLGASNLKQLLLQLFEHDSFHRETNPHGSDAQCISLLANVLLKRYDLCTVVGKLLVRSAWNVSAVAVDQADLGILKTLWDHAFWILTDRPCPSTMLRALWELQIPTGWELYVQRDKALCEIGNTCKEVERWLDGEIDGLRCEPLESDELDFEQLEMVDTGETGSSPSEISLEDYEGESATFSDDTIVHGTLERARTM